MLLLTELKSRLKPSCLLSVLPFRLSLWLLLASSVIGLGLVSPDRAQAQAASSGSSPALRKALDARLATKALRGAQIAALVQGEDGRELYARSADTALTPASNAKVLTALASLSRFGPTHRFETRVIADREPDASGEVGTLLLRGAGDPAMNSEDWWKVADALRSAGLRRVSGDLVLDDGVFDRERSHPSWGKVSSRAYHAPIGALTANYGAFGVSIAPGASAKDPVRVRLSPPVDHFRVDNRAKTVAAGKATRLRVDRSGILDADGDGLSEGTTIMVTGDIAAGEDPVAFYRSVLDPAAYAGAVFRRQLEAVGIEVAGRIRGGRAPEAMEVLLAYEGRPLSEIVELCMKYSNNQIAEALVKNLGSAAGAPSGGWQSGMSEMKRLLAEVGVPPVGLVDGSGLSYTNKVTPRALVKALEVGRDSFSFGPEFVASMPLANLDGTLADRTRGARGRVRAKTGTLNRTTALSGFAQLESGEWATFSILVNGYRGWDGAAIKAVDDFVATLVSTAR